MKYSIVFVLMCLLTILVPLPAMASWQIDVVDGFTNDAGSFAKLKIDSSDMPHIAYRVENPDSLKYVYLQDDHWIYETPQNAAGAGVFISMALNHLDLPMIAHFDPVESNLMFTERTGGSNLDTVILDANGNTGYFTAIDLDADENPCICYYNSDTKTIITKQRNKGWLSYFPDSGVDPSALDIKKDISGVIHLAYNDFETRTMKYNHNSGATWYPEIIDTNVDVSDCEIELDSNENIHIIYVETQTGDIRYAYRNGSSWVTETAVPAASAYNYSLSFLLDSTDVPHICFYSNAETLVYVNRKNGVWQGDAIDDYGDVGCHCSMDIDSRGLLHIAYFDRDAKSLKYAHQKPPSTPTPAPTATPAPTEIYTEMVMKDTYMTAGETFLLERTYKNSTKSPVAVDEYIILDVLGMYWFWPSWSETADFSQWTVPVSDPTTEPILTFEWPVVVGEFTGIRFWGAFLAANTVDVLSFHSIEWGYGESVPPLSLTSSAFNNSQAIPSKYTCDDIDVSPALAWNRPTQTIQSYAMIMDDPDAPGGDWVHWVIYDIPVSTQAFAQAIPTDPTLPDGSVQGLNSWGETGYRGPCPPGGLHRYFFKLYALDNVTGLAAGATKAEVLSAIEGHILFQSELMGTYER